MATIASLNVSIGASIAELQKGLKGAERELRASGARLSRIGNDVSTSLSLPLALLGGSAIQAAGEFESLRLAMRSTFQNAGRSIAEADAEVEKLRKSALAPGLDFEQAIRASIRLQSVGLSAEQSRKTVEELANAIASTGGTAENLSSVTVQMAQMISKGKVLAGDLRIIQENLPIVSDLMLKAFGTSNSEAIQKLGITGKEFVDKITAQMSGLNRVQGGISNAIVNAGSAIKVFLAGIGEEINKAFNIGEKSDQFAKALDGLAKSFAGLSDGTKRFIVEVGLLLVVTGPILKVFGGIIGLGSQVASAFKSILGAIGTLSGGILRLISGIRALGFAFSAVSVVALVAGALALADAMGWFNKEATQAEKLQASLNSLHEDAEKSIQAEKGAVSTLIGVLTNETSSRKAKSQALKDLKEISPEYFGQLKIENGLVIGLSSAYDGYIKNLLLAAKAKKAETRLIEIDDEKTKLLKEQTDLQAKLNTLSSAQTKPKEGFQNDSQLLSGNTVEAGATAARITEIQKITNALAEEEKALLSLSQAGFEAVAKEKAAAAERAKVEAEAAERAKAQADALGKISDKAKVLKEVLADIAAESDRQKLLGLDEIEPKLRAAENGLKKLLDAGWKPNTVEVMKLAEETRALQAEWNALKDLKKVYLEVDIIRKDNGEKTPDIASAKGFGDTSGNVKSRGAEQKIKQEQDWADAKTSIAFAAEQAAFDIFSNFADQKTEKQLAALEAEGKQRLANAKGNAALEAAIQADLDRKRAAIEKKASLRKKLAALGEATVNIAVGITKAIASAPAPFNIPAIVAAAAQGAIQLGVIASQKFAAGTRDAPGGLALVGERGPEFVNLPKHSQVFSAGQTATALRGAGQNVTLSGEFRIKGTDLVLVYDREKVKSERFR